MQGEPTGPIRTTIGTYHLHRQIARGGMARIHIARAVGAGSFSRLVAAKRIDPALATDSEFVEMFLQEARVASKIRHRNVVPVLDVVTLDGELVMVMELVIGAPLHKLFLRAQQAYVLSQQRIPVEIAVAIAVQVLAGLQAAHDAVDETGASLDIVHRDVSPQNIMIATDGTVRLLDFGVAKTAALVTRNGTFKGKLQYSAPEQVQGQVTRQTDIYSLGIVLWELLVGERLRAGRTEVELYGQLMASEPPSITRALAAHRKTIEAHVWAQLKALDPIVKRALARDLPDRFATAAAMEHALRRVVEPAPQVDVAGWLRSHGQDLVDQLEHLIAAEEASWRKHGASGVFRALPVAKPHRASTSLPTAAAKPSARARLLDADRLTALAKRHRRIAIALAQVAAVLAIVLLWLASTSQQPAANAAPPIELPIEMPIVMPAATATSPAPTPPPATFAPATVAPAIDTAQAIDTAPAPHPAVSEPVERKPTVRRAKKLAKPTKHIRSASRRTDCKTPFYYEGKKKIFKPSCL